jgi:hypothetical protein
VAIGISRVDFQQAQNRSMYWFMSDSQLLVAFYFYQNQELLFSVLDKLLKGIFGKGKEGKWEFMEI